MLLAFWKDLVSEKQPGPQGDFGEVVSHQFSLQIKRCLEGKIDVLCAYYAEDVLHFYPENQAELLNQLSAVQSMLEVLNLLSAYGSETSS